MGWTVWVNRQIPQDEQEQLATRSCSRVRTSGAYSSSIHAYWFRRLVAGKAVAAGWNHC